MLCSVPHICSFPQSYKYEWIIIWLISSSNKTSILAIRGVFILFFLDFRLQHPIDLSKPETCTTITSLLLKLAVIVLDNKRRSILNTHVVRVSSLCKYNSNQVVMFACCAVFSSPNGTFRVRGFFLAFHIRLKVCNVLVLVFFNCTKTKKVSKAIKDCNWGMCA